MKTRLTTLTWRGSASVDPRFSAAMLPWSIADIRNHESYVTLSVGVEDGVLAAYNTDFELQFEHKLKYILGYCRVIVKQEKGKKNADFLIPKATSTRPQPITIGNDNVAELFGPEFGLIYLLKNPQDPLLHIHFYECEKYEQMAELMQQMRDPATIGAGGSVGSIPQSIVSSSANANDLQKALRNQGIHSTPASNLKLSEQMRHAQHDGSPTVVAYHHQQQQQQHQNLQQHHGVGYHHHHHQQQQQQQQQQNGTALNRLATSKSYSGGLNHSASGGSVGAGTGTGGGASSISSSLSSLPDISANNSQFFEVLYVGKIKVSHKRVPYTFIDDALPKFKAYDAEKLRQQLDASRKNTPGTGADGGSSNDAGDTNAKPPGMVVTGEPVPPAARSSPPPTSDEPPESVFQGRRVSQFDLPTKKMAPVRRDRSASIGSLPVVEQNRTMVFLIGQSDLRLISPDRKQVLLHKGFRDVASCVHGQKNPDHFGIICRDLNNDGYIGYVFKCQSEQVADDIVMAISQAFQACSAQKQKDRAAAQIFSCEHCPMLWYHKLCTDIEGLSDKKTQYMIFKRIDTTLTDDEQRLLMEKYHGAEEASGQSVGEQNQFLMMLLRAHCESKQQRHVHDTVENRTEFLNQYLGGSGIFMKAKRSLTSSFDHLLKRRTSRDDFLGNGGLKDSASAGELKDGSLEPMPRARASTIGSSPSMGRMNSDPGSSTAGSQAPQLKSPMMDIFIKVGNSPREHNSSHTGSWRQAMLHRVVTPSKNMKSGSEEYMSPFRTPGDHQQAVKKKRTREELRELWRVGIKQTIILNRMDKENAHLQARQNEIKSNEIKRVKLEYDEITVCDKRSAEQWDSILEKSGAAQGTVAGGSPANQSLLYQAIKNGVPRSRRGEIWMFLAEQHGHRASAPVDTTNFPNFNTPYHVLLNNLTEHQHAIFIDLGRTFPDHKYYKDALGVGQLSLFNLLKAYSILDPELGYCQGLGFICAVLLLHLEEADAFELLKHLMFRRQMRAKYLPDMKQFQLQLYQLSRLLKDHLPELYDWFDQHDISPTLYAAPWILTVFSSHFPLGFVVRVFDLLFLESFDVIFRCAIALLEVHREALLQRDNFEDIMSYLKNVVPKIDGGVMEKVFRNVFQCDFSRPLIEYQVEYNVLQEEMTSQSHHLEGYKRLKEDHQQLATQFQFAQSSLMQLEKTRLAQQEQIQSLQSHVQTLENTVHTLARYIEQTVEAKSDTVLPTEICRILEQMQDLQHQQQLQAQKKRSPIFVDRKIGKSISFNSNLGLALNVLEEANEQVDGQGGSGTPTKKKPYFQNSFTQIRQQRASLWLHKLEECNTSPEHGSAGGPASVGAGTKILNSTTNSNNNNNNHSDDSGIATPISPQMHAPSTTPMVAESRPLVPLSATTTFDSHPLSSCGDVSVQYNGTTQLKSLKPRAQSRHGSVSSIVSEANNGDPRPETAMDRS
ncbi:TBC1 domain family member 1 isoform X2 [Anopheles aquasalis]|uniref:TBC1 domain family member 1 isoform X2 n=1 Tax=Anopheles aquasalis TaxID=42839 RepID=UPI00215A8429|nr:TBC1 domain family member 1 isoform X2 [Anopheles aquasalis]